MQLPLAISMPRSKNHNTAVSTESGSTNRCSLGTPNLSYACSSLTGRSCPALSTNRSFLGQLGPNPRLIDRTACCTAKSSVSAQGFSASRCRCFATLKYCALERYFPSYNNAPTLKITSCVRGSGSNDLEAQSSCHGFHPDSMGALELAAYRSSRKASSNFSNEFGPPSRGILCRTGARPGGRIESWVARTLPLCPQAATAYRAQHRRAKP